MKIKKFVLCAAAFASALSIACSLSAATLNVATSATFPPFEFQDSKTGAVQGFEIDLVKAMGENLKVVESPHESSLEMSFPIKIP